jgi:multidrug efflux system membrane fusion protein
VSSVDNQLNTKTSNIRVRARFENADGLLIPGLFARIKVAGSKAHPAVLVDDGAISTDQAKKYVLVVDKSNVVHYREVTLGDLHEGLRIISTGLESGEKIVVNGLQRARPNDVVKANTVEMVKSTPAKSA